jgi:stringent starvation protein B
LLSTPALPADAVITGASHTTPVMPEVSTKPYLLRAIYEWCTDNGYTPHIAVVVDSSTRVPMQFVKNGEIVLNISFEATSGLKMENDNIHFSARFGGVSRDILIPVENVIAIYARENGQGMAFEAPCRPRPRRPSRLLSRKAVRLCCLRYLFPNLKRSPP